MSCLTVFPGHALARVQHLRTGEKACQWGPIESPNILMTECVRCDHCERLYADTTVCPEWRIIDDNEYNERELRILPLQPVQ